MTKQACPITDAARIIGNKWTLEMIYYLRDRQRFCELQENIGGVNPATLTQRLKALESAGIVNRYAISGGPRHVEYELTEKGKDLLEIMSTLAGWAQRWHPEAE